MSTSSMAAGPSSFVTWIARMNVTLGLAAPAELIQSDNSLLLRDNAAIPRRSPTGGVGPKARRRVLAEMLRRAATNSGG